METKYIQLLVFSIIICLSLAILFIGTRVKFGGVGGLITKMIASLAFSIFGIVAYNYGPTYAFDGAMFFAIGLIFGMVGDILLDLKMIYPRDEKPYLNFGMTAFGIGHIFYTIGIVLIISTYVNILFVWLGAVLVATCLTPLIMFFSKKLKLNFGQFYFQSFLYTFVLIFVTTFAIISSFFNNVISMLAIALTLFLISDLLLSFMYFGGKEKDNKIIILNHSFYYVAQILIMAFIYFI